MKKLLFILIACVSFYSCSQDYLEGIEEVNTSQVKHYTINPKYSKEEVLEVSKQLLYICKDVPDLFLSKELGERLFIEEDNLDLIIEAIYYYESQKIFGDTVGEFYVYDIWKDMIVK